MSADVLKDHCGMKKVGLGLKIFISATTSSFFSSQITDLVLSFMLVISTFMSHAMCDVEFKWLYHELLMIFVNAHECFAGENEGMI